MIFRSSPHRDLEKRIGYRFRKTAYLDAGPAPSSALGESRPAPRRRPTSS
ncbi:MAG: hypothetical protein U1F77_08245 [Kiritimatiellia bacterium]